MNFFMSSKFNLTSMTRHWVAKSRGPPIALAERGLATRAGLDKLLRKALALRRMECKAASTGALKSSSSNVLGALVLTCQEIHVMKHQVIKMIVFMLYTILTQKLRQCTQRHFATWAAQKLLPIRIGDHRHVFKLFGRHGRDGRDAAWWVFKVNLA